MGIVTGYLAQLVNNGIKLLNGGADVSSSNPLPVSQPLGVIPQFDIISGKMFRYTGTLASGGASKYSAFQLFNPADSGKNVLVHTANVWWGSGTNVALGIYTQTPLNGSPLSTDACTNLKANAGVSSARLYSDNTLTAIPSVPANLSPTRSSQAAITPPGTGIIIGNSWFYLPVGWGITVYCETANMAMNVNFTFEES